MSNELTTLLTEWHRNRGAVLSSFGGYSMPLWYPTGPIKEHQGVLRGAGLFDTSHMSQLLIEGPDARKLLQRALTKDLDPKGASGKSLSPGRCSYGFLLDEQGHLIDDAIVMMEARDIYLLVVNAGMGSTVTAHLLALGDELDVAVSDLTGKLCKLDLQGPQSIDILREVIKPTYKLAKGIPYFSFIGHYDHLQEGVQSTGGFSVMISRTGYTGELGFELFVRPDAFTALWEQLLEAGSERGLIPCGLAARDSLRAGAMLPLSHQDLGDWPARNHPWEFALCWQDGQFSKNFVGAEALLKAEKAPHTYAFLGQNGRKVENGAEVRLGDTVIGTVTTCVTDMGMDRVEETLTSLTTPGAAEDFSPRGLCCGFVRVDRPLDMGRELILADRRREIPVTLVQDLRPDRTARRAWPDFSTPPTLG